MRFGSARLTSAAHRHRRLHLAPRTWHRRSTATCTGG